MIHEAWFRFKGIDSRQMGVIVTAMPETVRAERRVQSITIAGRNGTLHMDEGVYESYDRIMECALKKRANLDAVAAWLVGSGDMIFSTEPDKVYKVTISNKISISSMMRMFQKFQVIMDTQPFKYSVNPDNDLIEITNLKSVSWKSRPIHNKGTVESEPIITVYANSSVLMQLNGNKILLEDIDGHITIDSEMMEVYKDGENANSKFSSSDGFPKFRVGENVFRIAGTLEKIVIEPKWRWL